jgi:hypothetical protein
MPIPARRSRRSALLLAASLVLLGAAPVAAQNVSVHAGHGDSSWIVPRVPLARAPASVATQDRQIALVLLDTTLVLQFTDVGLREFHHVARDSAPSGLGSRIFAQMVGAALGELFDHGIAYPISSLGRARADGSRLVLEDRNGHRIFDDVEVNGRDAMDGFVPAEAARFAAIVNRAIAR